MGKTLASLISAHGNALIDRILATDENVSNARRTLIIDDPLIQLLSTFIQGSQLKARGFERWFRLSNFADVEPETGSGPAPTCVVVMFLAGADSDRQQETVKILLRLFSGNSRGPVRVKLCFVPRRTCGQVSYILLSVRHGVNNPALAWQEDGASMVLGKLRIDVIDVPILLYSLDSSTLTMCTPRTYKRVHFDGDLYPMASLMEGLKQVFSHASLSSVVSVIGIGPDGKLIAKKIANYLANASAEVLEESGALSVNPSASNPLAKSDEVSGSAPLSGMVVINALHSYATGLINAQLAAEPEADSAVNASRPKTRNSIPPEVLSDAILNKCIVQMSSSLKEDVDFVYDEIRESGLTRRSQQPSFRIRLPEELTWPPPRSDGEKAEELNIKSIIVFDRAVDWISPLLTPFTYEAMLDLQWGIEGVHSLQVMKNPQATPPSETVSLSDGLFLRIRDMLLSDIGPALHTEALKIQAQAPSGAAASSVPSTGSVDEMHSALLKIKEHERAQRELSTHVSLVSQLVRDLWRNPTFYTILKIEDDILNSASTPVEVHTEILCQLAWRSAPIVDVLRLTMLVLLVRGGTQTRVADVRGLVNLVQSVLSALSSVHGLTVFQTWYELESVIFKDATPPALPLGTGGGSHGSASPFSFVHSGYTPLSVEVLESVIKQVAHPTCPPSNMWKQKIKFADNHRKEGDILLVFPHHVTYSELAALRCLARAVGRNFFVIASSVDGYQTFISGAAAQKAGAARYTEALHSVIL